MENARPFGAGVQKIHPHKSNNVYIEQQPEKEGFSKRVSILALRVLFAIWAACTPSLTQKGINPHSSPSTDHGDDALSPLLKLNSRGWAKPLT